MAGSFNYLANTAFKLIFAIRKLCRFTQSPGHKPFEAANHLLHHIRYNPPKAIKFYRNAHHAPLAEMLKAAGYPDNDPMLAWFTDSAWDDCDEHKSTGCYLGLLQGGSVDHNSFVPAPVAQS